MNEEYDTQAIAKELTKVHQDFCPSDEGPRIWVGDIRTADPHRGKDRLEVEAECQNCMKGVITVMPDRPEYHIRKETKRRHVRVS